MNGKENFRGCSFLNILSEIPIDNTKILNVIQSHKADLRNFFSEWVNDEELSDHIYMLFESSIIESQLFKSNELIEKSKNIHGALVLGTGGASRAVQYILKKLDIQYSLISRSKKGIIRYQDIDKALFSSINLIINTTPLGMSPNIKNKPEIPYEWLNEKYFLYDLIYNPEKTIFLSEGLKMGCKIKNGHDMLILQAEKAWHIWNQTEI